MKRPHVIWVLGGMAMTAALAACSNDVRIVPEPAGTTASTTTTTGSTTSSSTGGTMGGTGGAGGASTSSSSGGATKLVTADGDMAQYQSITVTGNNVGTPVKVLEGPFFVTDAFAGSQNAPTFTTVAGADCSLAQDKHTPVLQVIPPPGGGSSSNPQIHGIRLPVLKGQSLCVLYGLASGYAATVLGFRPY